MKNWMDRFNTADEYITYQILEHDTPSINKSKLFHKAKSMGLPVRNYATKKETLEALLENNITLQEIIDGELIGIRPQYIQEKFGISRNDVYRLAQSGFLKIHAYKSERFYGKTLRVPLYDVYQFFELTPEEVHAELAKCKRRRRKNDDLEN